MNRLFTHSSTDEVASSGLVRKTRPATTGRSGITRRRSIEEERVLQNRAHGIVAGHGAPGAVSYARVYDGALVTPLVPDAERLDLWVLQTSHDRAMAVADRLACILERLHGATVSDRLDTALVEGIPVPPLTLRTFEELSVATRRFLGHLGPRDQHRLRSVRTELQRGDSFVHGDLTPDNVLVRNDVETVHLIDWECAGTGRPEADLGALLGGLLHGALWGLPGESAEEVAGSRASRLNRVLSFGQHAINSTGALDMDNELLLAAAGNVLLCRVFVYSSATPSLDAFAVLSTRIACGLLHGELPASAAAPAR